MHALEQKFDIFPGFGKKTEKTLKANGFYTWDQIQPPFAHATLGNKLEQIYAHIQEIKQKIGAQDIPALAQVLKPRHHWMFVPYISRPIAFLDIETTGLSKNHDIITSIAVFDGRQTYDFVNGENLDDFPAFIGQFSTIVTYFGKVFDLPFCERFFGMQFPQLHLDLCFLARRVGLTGGLKSVEVQLGLGRQESAGVTGYLAVKLWKKFQKTGDRRYLETLLAYNNEDVYSLEVILAEVYNRLCVDEGIEATPMPVPPLCVQNPYHQHAAILKPLL